MPREAQRGGPWIEYVSLSSDWLEAPHKQICDQGGSPPDFFTEPKRSPAYAGFQTEIHFKPRASPQAAREVPHKQNYLHMYDQQNYDQGDLPTRRLMYARPGSWLFGWLVELCPGSLWLAGRLRPRDGQREAQRGPERRSGDRTNLPCVWLEAPTIRFTTREDPHRFLGGTPEETPTDYYELGFQTEIHLKPRASPQAELCTTREAPHKQNYDQGGRITTRDPMYFLYASNRR